MIVYQMKINLINSLNLKVLINIIKLFIKKNYNNNDEFIEKHKENIQLNYIKDNLNNEYNENFYKSILKEEPDKSDLSFSDNTKYNE